MKTNTTILLLVLLGAINTSMGLFDIDPIDWLGYKTSDWVSIVLYLVILLATLNVLFDRNFYLPFLGKTIFPCNVLRENIPDNVTKLVEVDTRPNTFIIYWAAEPSDTDNRDWDEVYVDYTNAGVVRSDENGIAKMFVRSPTGYEVPVGKLDSHIHYRECLDNYVLGEVKTVKVLTK
jgi:uncharacterized membrane protein YuzA (DUF378 family)